jgi:hypothetical protein
MPIKTITTHREREREKIREEKRELPCHTSNRPSLVILMILMLLFLRQDNRHHRHHHHTIVITNTIAITNIITIYGNIISPSTATTTKR